MFVVERDPRDVYIINKYIWARNHEPVPYPTDVDEFCKCYASLRKMEKAARHPGIMRIRFEDLVYHYEEAVGKVLEHLGEDKSRHTGRKTKFIPEASIENTQLYISKPEFYEEGKVIEERLEEYLYPFPYERKADYEKTF